MAESQNESLTSARERAIDYRRAPGATIKHRYLERSQELVGVTKDDLEDLLGFDGIGAFFGGLGMFLLSGAAWLLVEKTLDEDGFIWEPIISFCVLSILFGAACLGAGVFFHVRKRSRIQRIFSQTKSFP